MNVYIITVGRYEDNVNAFAHTDFNKVIDKIMNIKDTDSPFEGFATMECWEDGKRIYSYGEWMYDMVNKTRDFTREQLISDIQNHIENWEYKG